MNPKYQKSIFRIIIYINSNKDFLTYEHLDIKSEFLKKNLTTKIVNQF
jgi:hypothetical protein